MNRPHIECIPLREAVSSDSTTTLDVVIKILAPEPVEQPTRPPLNISLVIDRSGSMTSENKLEYAKQAACYAVEHLMPHDRVSVVVYDDQVKPLVTSTLATNKPSIIQKIKQVRTGGSTALHAGWVEGGVQVSQYLDPSLMNRVILLSDGLANVGESNPDVIGTDVHGLMQQGISTTTLGLGNDYNEDLLQGMALSGDGNYYYIESPQQLATIFQAELQGLLATVGRAVTLGLEPQGSVQVDDVLNDLESSKTGELKLPNLTIGSPLILVIRLKIPPLPPTSAKVDLCALRLSWDAPEQSERQTLRAMVQLPVVNDNQLQDFPFNPDVQEQTALMLVARAKREMIQQLDRGDIHGLKQSFGSTRHLLRSVPQSPLMVQEMLSVDLLESDLEGGRHQRMRKSSSHEAQMRGRNFNQDQYDDYLLKKLIYLVHDRLHLIQADITTQPVDAIVTSTDRQFSGRGSGVDAAVHQAAGPELADACHLLQPCQPGDVRMTPGFNLPARWILHTVSPKWLGGTEQEPDLLTLCYQNCLELAVKEGLTTIAFPVLGAGGLGFPLPQAASIAIRAIGTFLSKNQSIQTVHFVCNDRAAYQCYDAILR